MKVSYLTPSKLSDTYIENQGFTAHDTYQIIWNYQISNPFSVSLLSYLKRQPHQLQSTFPFTRHQNLISGYL